MNIRSKEIDSRYRHIVSFIVVMMLVLAVRLFIVTMVQHDDWVAKASEQITKTIYTSAPRGNIYDRNGVLLAGNKQVFTVTFNASSLSTDEINTSAYTLISKLNENGDEFIDDFPIVEGDDGTFTYTFDTQLAKWLSDNGYEAGTSAQTVFDLVKAEYNIDPSLSRYDAMDVLSEKHNVSLPISVKTMKFTYESQKESFLSRFGFSASDIEKGITAEDAFHALRTVYKIDEALSDAEARNIFIVRNKISETSSQRYIPITIASGISKKSVIYFEEMRIAGVEISSETERYYPYGSTLCHVIGYMGSITEGEAEHYIKEKKYLPTDQVGKAGAEYSMEDVLHGVSGYKTVIVNSAGEYVSTISSQEARKGRDTYLSMDVFFQQKVESALAKAIDGISTCNTGAAVVLDVKTGDVLAMVSNPGYDLNMFADGISEEEWASVQPENPRASFSPTPMYNLATNAAVAPGSTFKPLTAIVALECGLDPNMRIWDDGFIDIGGRKFACYKYNAYGLTDGYENLEWGMGNSCNYYFACIATNRDWKTGASLGYKEDINIDRILSRAREFGLGENTGIEIPETAGTSVSEKTKTENYRIGVWSALYEQARLYFPPEVYNDYSRLSENISTIASWIYDNPEYADLINMIDEKTDVIDDQVENCASMVKFDYFNQAQWTTFDVFNLSIGQGDNNYTPLQVANYLATIGNNGLRNQVSIIYGVEGEGRSAKKAPYETGLSEDNRDEILNAMRRVCLSGSLADSLSKYPIPVAGKTGTAQYQAIKQPPDEVDYIQDHLSRLNSAAGTEITWDEVQAKMSELMKSDANAYPTENDTVDSALIELSEHRISMSMINSYKDKYEDFAWLAALAPADNPEIAIAILLPEGGLASDAGDAVADILNAYYHIGDAEGRNAGIYSATGDDGSNKLQ